MAAEPTEGNLQGKLKNTSIVFDPSSEDVSFSSYKSDLTAYFEEWCIAYLLTVKKTDPAFNSDGDAAKMKRYNRKVAYRFLKSTLKGDAKEIAEGYETTEETEEEAPPSNEP